MKYQIDKIMISILLLASSFATNAVSVYPSGIFITPESPTTNDFIVAEVTGSYATPGYSLLGGPVTSISGNNVVIDFNAASPTGIVPLVLDPFTYSVDIGKLDVGSYDITTNFYIDGLFDSAISNSFYVSAVPIPAALYLFISGFVSMIALAKRKSLKNASSRQVTTTV